MENKDEVLRKLDIIAQLLAMDLFKNNNVNEQIEKLDALGLKNKEIATVLGKTENQVKVTRSLLKSKPAKSKKQDL